MFSCVIVSLGNTQHDYPKLNNYIQNDLSNEATCSSKDTKQRVAAALSEFDDPTDALEMTPMTKNNSTAHNIKKGNNLYDEIAADHPSSLTLDSGYGVSGSYGPESPPPNYDELDLLPVATNTSSSLAAVSCAAVKKENDTGGYQNLSYRSKDGDGDGVEEKSEKFI